MSRVALGFAAVILAGALGCGGDGEAMEFAITLTEDFTSYDCYPVVPEGLGPSDLKTVESLIGPAEKFYRQTHDGIEPIPRGLTLTVIDREGTLRSWLSTVEPSECIPDGRGCFSGTGTTCCGSCDITGICRGGVAFSSAEIYTGEPEEEILEGLYEPRSDLLSSDPGSGEPYTVCESKARVRAKLSATLVDSLVDGRVRRTDLVYPAPSPGIRCELRMECARDYFFSGAQR